MPGSLAQSESRTAYAKGKDGSACSESLPCSLSSFARICLRSAKTILAYLGTETPTGSCAGGEMTK